MNDKLFNAAVGDFGLAYVNKTLPHHTIHEMACLNGVLRAKGLQPRDIVRLTANGGAWSGTNCKTYPFDPSASHFSIHEHSLISLDHDNLPLFCAYLILDACRERDFIRFCEQSHLIDKFWLSCHNLA